MGATLGSRPGWPSPADSPRSGGRPGPRPGSRCVSRWPGRSCTCRPAAPRLPRGVVEDELNVDVVEVATELGDVLSYELVPNYRVLGPRLGGRVQQLRSALGTVDTAAAAVELAAGRPVTVELGDGTVELASRRGRAAGAGPARLRRLARRSRGGGTRPDPRRRSAPAGPRPRGRATRPGRAQGGGPRGLRLDPAVPGGGRRPRTALRRHRPRGAGPCRDHLPAWRADGPEPCSCSRRATPPARSRSGSRRRRDRGGRDGPVRSR